MFLFPATGSGGWETALTNTLSAGDKVLASNNGMFSQKWIDMCERHGLDVEVVSVPWGQGLPIESYAEILTNDTDHQIRVVLATHNETATGAVEESATATTAASQSTPQSNACAEFQPCPMTGQPTRTARLSFSLNTITPASP